MRRRSFRVALALMLGTLSLLAGPTASSQAINPTGEGASCPNAPGYETGWSCKIYVYDGDGNVYYEDCWVQIRNFDDGGTIIGDSRAVCTYRPEYINLTTSTAGDTAPAKRCASGYTQWRDTNKWLCNAYEVTRNDPAGNQWMTIYVNVNILSGWSVDGPQAGPAWYSPYYWTMLY